MRNRDGHPQLRVLTIYFAVYLAYLCVHPEGELLHWLTLVALPVGGVWWLQGRPPARDLLASIGISRCAARRGWGWVVGLGAAFQVLQLLNVRQRGELAGALSAPMGPLLPLVALGLLLATVATTEEVFFRGLIQSRLARWRGPAVAFVVDVASFVLYHVPYAYLKPSWPSAGNLPAALAAAIANGGIGGAAMSWVFWRSRGNLLGCIVLHALIDLAPAVRLVHRTWFA